MDRLLSAMCSMGAAVLLVSWVLLIWQPALASPVILAVIILAGVAVLTTVLAVQLGSDG